MKFKPGDVIYTIKDRGLDSDCTDALLPKLILGVDAHQCYSIFLAGHSGLMQHDEHLGEYKTESVAAGIYSFYIRHIDTSYEIAPDDIVTQMKQKYKIWKMQQTIEK